MQWKVDTREVEEQLKKLARQFGPDAVENITEGAAEMVAAELRKRAPLGPTGRLRRSPVVRKMTRRHGRAAPHIAAMDRTVAPHAWLVEYGRYKNPYFRPTIEAMSGPVGAHLRSGVQGLLGRFR